MSHIECTVSYGTMLTPGVSTRMCYGVDIVSCVVSHVVHIMSHVLCSVAHVLCLMCHALRQIHVARWIMHFVLRITPNVTCPMTHALHLTSYALSTYYGLRAPSAIHHVTYCV